MPVRRLKDSSLDLETDDSEQPQQQYKTQWHAEQPEKDRHDPSPFREVIKIGEEKTAAKSPVLFPTDRADNSDWSGGSVPYYSQHATEHGREVLGVALDPSIPLTQKEGRPIFF